MTSIEARTACNTRLNLTVAINYGGRDEIARAAARMAERIARGEIQAPTEADFAACLDTAGQPDPDLVIRTSGEQRLSGFLMWQSAYSEFYFCEALWPDFRRVDFLRALRDYASRQRRFGA